MRLASLGAGSLIHSYSEDVTRVLKIFVENKDSPPIGTGSYRNLPPIAGALTWCRGLLSRVKLPMEKMKLLDRKVGERSELALTKTKTKTRVRAHMLQQPILTFSFARPCLE